MLELLEGLLKIPVPLLTSPDIVYAYLDPGTGSLMLQALIGGIAAALFVVRQYWGKIKSFLASYFARQRRPPEDRLSG